ncbi:UBX domain-containing protein 1-like isoform X3 [Artemia franciscana]|uniref:UBX domain-containing protein 1-like isoform X3 n=1 Tax=Artemia franciscana TaxID=6661 RepID=UPI0032DA6E00
MKMFQEDKALAETNNAGLEQAMEWMISHEDVQEEITSAPTQSIPATSKDEAEPLLDATQSVAKSIKCDDCGKMFRNTEQAELHAVRTNHANFSESSEEKKPLTEEERKVQLEQLQGLMKQKRLEREEREKREAIEREKKRIQAGKEMAEFRRKNDEIEMKKLAEQRRREKEEERQARERVRRQIEEDKLARKKKVEEKDVVSPKPEAVPQDLKDYKQATIQVRLTDGSTLKQIFNAKEPLSAVKLYIDLNRKDGNFPYKLMTTFPRKVFTEEDYDTPLNELDLVPSAVLVASKIM